MVASFLCFAGSCRPTPADDLQQLVEVAKTAPEHSLIWVTRMSDFSHCVTAGMSDLVRLLSGASGLPVDVFVIGGPSDTLLVRRLLTRERINADIRLLGGGRSIRVRLESGIYLLEHDRVAAMWQLSPGRPISGAPSGRKAILDHMGF
jgi:hypothetical protein